MLIIGVVLMFVGIVILARGTFAEANTVGLCAALGGMFLIVAAVLNDDSGVSGAAVLGAPLWWPLHDWRYRLQKLTDRVMLWLVFRMPGRLRMWFVVDATVKAREMYPHPTGYAGPDGLEYRHIYDGATRARTQDGA